MGTGGGIVICSEEFVFQESKKQNESIKIQASNLSTRSFIYPPPGRVQRALCVGPAPHCVVGVFAHLSWKHTPLVLAGTRFAVQDPFAH